VLPISKIYNKHRLSYKEYPPGNIKDFAAAELHLDHEEHIEVYNLENISYMIINKKDIYFFNPTERKV